VLDVPRERDIIWEESAVQNRRKLFLNVFNFLRVILFRVCYF
jgi:hypothetical protein